METFKATVTENVESNRVLALFNDGDGNATLSIAKAGEADFHSTTPLEKDAEVNVKVKGSTTWNIEAGEDLSAGQFVDVGAGGALVSSDKGVGYVVNSVKEGGLAKLVRSSDGGTGKQGEPGKPGKDGKSAYQVALDNGFEGTEDEWLASLKGPKGDPGEDAPTE